MDPNETKIYSAFLIAAFILGVFFIFFIVTILRHQRKNQQLYKEKILVEINTLESERSRIASDLHDDLGPTLSSVKLLINNISLASRADEASILKANDQIDSILQRVRTISNNLMPQALIRKGLKTAVDELVSEMNEEDKMKVRFFSDDGLGFAPEAEVHVYRIIQEIVHNTRKHARATSVEITISKTAKGVQVIVADNGSGFDSRNARVTSKGLGLHNILSRVESMKGILFLDSNTVSGTRYTIEIPVKQL